MILTFLGTGTSFGVPQLGCSCDVCRSTDPRDRRARTGAIIDTGTTRLLIDAPPELRLQLLAVGVSTVDALFITHDHADHIHGIDDVRGLGGKARGPLPVYAAPDVLASLGRRFPYAFDGAPPIPGTSKPELEPRPIEPGATVRVGDATVEAILVPHGAMRVHAYRVGPVGYITDAKTVPPDAIARLRGVSVLVLNALRRTPHPTHLSVSEAVAVARQIGAKRTLLTHITHDLGHAALSAELPSGIEPAYDGLVVSVD